MGRHHGGRARRAADHDRLVAEFVRQLYADELGDSFGANWAARAVFVQNVLSGQSHWCDNVRTTRSELRLPPHRLARKRAGGAQAPLRQQVDVGIGARGPPSAPPVQPGTWLGSIFDIVVPSAGDAYTVNAGAMDFNAGGEPFANRHAASLRHISDLADPQASVFIHSGGQSGNPLSPHYRTSPPPGREVNTCR